MAETNCARLRRESVPVGLREKGCEAPVDCRAFVLIYIPVAGLLRLAFSGFGFGPEPIAAVPSYWWRAGSFRPSSPVDMMGEPVEQGAGEPFGAEYASTFIERQVAGDQHGATFIALTEHLKSNSEPTAVNGT
jgi:hypothetical protein